MAPYLILTTALFLLSLLDYMSKTLPNSNKDKNFHLALYALTLVFLIIFVGFREIGFDYDNYKSLFNKFSIFWRENSEVESIDKGYAFLNHISPSFRFLLVSIATVTLTLILSFFYKFSPLPFASTFFYIGAFLLTSAMGQYRQALAMAIVLWAFALYDKKLYFTFLVLCASFFHVSAILALSILLMSKKICAPRTYLLFLVFAVIMNLTAGSLIMSLSNFMPSLIAYKFSFYADTQQGIVYGFNMAMLLRVIVFLLFYHNRNIISSYRHGEAFLNIYFISLLIYMGFGFIPEIAARGSSYFYFIEFVLAGMLIGGSRKGIIYLAFFSCISIYRLAGTLTEWSHNYIPYSNELFSAIGL